MNSLNDPKYRIPQWFSDIDQAQGQLIEATFNFFKQNQPIHSLVNKKSFQLMDLNHFADCIVACRHIRSASSSTKVYHDLLSGNALPGIILAILFPEVEVVFVDDDTKKIEFIKSMLLSVKIQNLKFLNSRIEKIPSGTIQVGIFRGNADLSRTLMTVKDAISEGGFIFHIKSDNWKNEIVQMPSQIFSIFDTQLLLDYKLPESSLVNSVVISKRLKS